MTEVHTPDTELPSVQVKDRKEPKVRKFIIPEVVSRLLPVGTLLAAFALWAICGKIPERIDEGRAVIQIPRANVSIQPREGGRVLKLNIQPGDFVKKGQVLAILELPELETELEDKRQRLADLKRQDKQVNTVQNNRSQLNTTTTERKRQANLRQIEALQIQMASNQSQRNAFLEHLRYLNRFQSSTSKRLEAYDKLSQEGVVARLNFIPYLYQFNQQAVANSVNQVQVELDRLNATDDGLRAQMQALKAQNEALSTEKRTIDLQDTVNDVTRYNLIADQQREINTLEAKLKANRQVVSLYNGKVEEVAVNIGEVVAPGGRIGTLNVSNLKTKPNVVALFKVGDAKKLRRGMEVEVIPDLYERERYGGIVAKVIEVAQQPVTQAELSSLVGSNELATKLLLGRDKDDPDKPMPVNASVNKVFLALQVDSKTPSGYKWTGGTGSPQAISDGTTADIHAIVDKRSLVSYLTPTFRWITGIYSQDK